MEQFELRIKYIYLYQNVWREEKRASEIYFLIERLQNGTMNEDNS